MSQRIAAVVEQLGQLRGASGWRRGQESFRAFQLVRALSSDERRDLAIAIGRRAAPELVPQIEERTGADLTDAQVSAMFDLFERIDGNDIDQFVAELRSGDVDGAAIAGAAQMVQGVLAADDMSNDEIHEPAPTEEGRELSDSPQSHVHAAASATPADKPTEQPARGVGVAAVVAPEQPEPIPYAPRPNSPSVAWDPEWRVDFSIEFPESPPLDRGHTPPVPTVANYQRAVVALDPSPTGQARAGWRDRRHVQDQIVNGTITREEIVSVCRSFAASSDRTWVVTDAWMAGLLDEKDLRRLVRPSVAERLVTRAETASRKSS